MDRKFEILARTDFWWEVLSAEHKAALNILFSQEPHKLKKEGIKITRDQLDVITSQLARYRVGDKLTFRDKEFESPVSLAGYLIELHPGIRPGRTFSEF